MAILAVDENDEAVRSKMLDVQPSLIVRSPAGSGKTQLLTLRFLALLCHVDKDPEEVLAITFTRKAAAEMRERILQALLNANDSIENPAQLFLQTRQLARQVWWRDSQENSIC
jgi:ATP-dependent helicase/nuclease subunit A